MIESLLQDVRYALRMLRRNPGFASVAVLTLALGIGANSAFFSVVDALVWRPLPVERPEDLVVFAAHGSGPSPNVSFSYPLFEDYREAGDDFTDIAASGGTVRRQMRGDAAAPEPIDVEAVSGNFFTVVGVRATIGRMLADSDDQPSRPLPVIVLSHAFWTRRFGGDTAVLGRPLTIDGAVFTVVGVADRQFRGFEVGDNPDAWWPLQMTAAMSPPPLNKLTSQRNSEWLLVAGRLRPGGDLRAAQAQMSLVFRRDLEGTLERRRQAGRPFAAADRDALLAQRLELMPGRAGSSELRMRFARPLLVLTIGVGVVLLVACANIANLLLSRAAARRHEIAVRVAVGAGRRRVVRQLLTEGVVLSMLGGLAGLIVAAWVSQLLVSFVPDPDITLDVRIDGRVLFFTLAVATIAGLLFGSLPAFASTAQRPQVGLSGARGIVSGRTAVQNTLVIAQVALCVIVLYGAGLFSRTLHELRSVELGFEDARLTVFRVAAPPGTEGLQRTSIYRDIVARLEQQPGVSAASFSFFGLLSNMNRTQRVQIDGYIPLPDESMSIQFSHVERQFFGTTGIDLLEGRVFDTSDETTGRRVVIVDRMMARRYFEGRAVGRHITLMGPSGPEGDALEVIGVVADAKYRNLREEALPTVYTLVDQRTAVVPVPALVQVRTSGTSDLREEAILRVVHAVAPGSVVTDVATMTDVIDRGMAQERLLSTLAGLFGVLALAVSAVGLYGVRSFAVACRTREFGVRMALGASRFLIFRSVLRQGMLLVTVGAAFGAGAAVLVAQTIDVFLYRIEPDDPTTLVGVASILGLSTLVASLLPARRATRIDPITALRSE